MRQRRIRELEETELNITPMLDVVFIMLIFFIVTASFIKESGLEVIRPEAVTSVRQDRAAIMIAVGAESQIWINKKEVDLRAVRAIVEKLYAENPQGGVVIQADEKSKTGIVTQVMRAATLAGVPSVAIATEEQ